eukprot:scaffold10138_cov61-Phaeocystis_antarctica.AAC.2
MHAEAFSWQGKGHAEVTNVRTARGRFFWHAVVLGTAWWPFHVRTGMVLSSMMCWLFILIRLNQGAVSSLRRCGSTVTWARGDVKSAT